MKCLMMMTLLSFCFTNIVSQNQRDKKLIENTFKKWNEKTIGSINEQIVVTNNTRIKSTLTNVVDILKLGLYSKTGNEKRIVDKGKPARYKFLQTIFANPQIKKPFYVVETVFGGEVVVINNYIIKNNKRGSQVVCYSYGYNTWVKVYDTTIANIDLHRELININKDRDSLSGNNYSGVILSEFKSLDIMTHYYIPSSISDNSPVLKVINLKNH